VGADGIARHAYGQTLHVADGYGLVHPRDGQIIVMQAGDTVYTPGTSHWHAALPYCFMTHLALSDSGADIGVVDVEWGDHGPGAGVGVRGIQRARVFHRFAQVALR
jgi:hypothetical protein